MKNSPSKDPFTRRGPSRGSNARNKYHVISSTYIWFEGCPAIEVKLRFLIRSLPVRISNPSGLDKPRRPRDLEAPKKEVNDVRWKQGQD
jgi:hypothetical protein